MLVFSFLFSLSMRAETLHWMGNWVHTRGIPIEQLLEGDIYIEPKNTRLEIHFIEDLGDIQILIERENGDILFQQNWNTKNNKFAVFHLENEFLFGCKISISDYLGNNVYCKII